MKKQHNKVSWGVRFVKISGRNNPRDTFEVQRSGKSRGRTLIYKREEPKRMFLILIPKSGMHNW